MPSAPPKKGTYRKTASTMKLMPIVVMARKSSRTRRLGSPRSSPTSAVTATTIGSAAQKERPALTASSAAV